MTKFQISKYDPAFKTEEGKYLKDDWTSISDIGKIYDGKLLTVDDYLDVEAKYINVIKKILDETESSYLRVVGLEKFDDSLNKIDNVPYDNKSDEIYKSLEEGKVLNLNDAIILTKLILRENVWCYLTNKYVTIQIGNDYYLNVALEIKPSFFNSLDDDLGLFVRSI
ncbi:hypothetical protein EJ994_17340 [Maribacter sp. MJ134]|uniref:hypothetical protein n=1 Tax=Maribacter sp. MJ134 TaxID=2496865 RepID=UPI000F816728|nr:hypothetical protein [Maribacter sp. MJ134]AZQ57274.1 hypothetical protein EJ994_00055 [Maribacter sp. MJ134]AZQ57280.1 hypothetical protein EJ994_00085 [Maribacter sp. MJ134]AZQ60458.1 hypothetical protein EJ994_17255 [Maribacter sp. MJ134]AZQ60475.1 hypothetical protein EJ994_17340 [Maribacter sp. MJ134]